MCTLHSVLPNDCTLRYYAEKVATFCSICRCKWEACLTPASWLWDIISLNSLTTCLACGAAGFKWRSRAAKQSFLCLGWQYTWKPVVPSVTLCSWEGHALQEVMARSLPNKAAKPLPKEPHKYSHGKKACDFFPDSRFRELVRNGDHVPLNNISIAGAGLHLSQIKMLYLRLIVIHSLVYGPCVLQGVLETHTTLPSATFCIRISNSVDRCVQSHSAVRQLPLDSVSEEEQEGKLFQLRSALSSK